jgi:hypothetical protein
MDEMFSRAWEQLFGRLDGPLFLRFVLQPLVAAALAVRAGLADARARRIPYFWSILSEPHDRRQRIRDGWGDVGKVFGLAFLLDCAYQVMVFRWVYPAQAAIVAAMLAVLPYLLVRGPSARVTRRWTVTR